MRACVPLLLCALLPSTVVAGSGAIRVDPTRPLSGAGQQVASPDQDRIDPGSGRPSLVLISSRRALALVDGQLLRPGDVWGESRVSRIGLQGLWLRAADGSEIHLRHPVSDKRWLAAGAVPTKPGESR